MAELRVPHFLSLSSYDTLTALCVLPVERTRVLVCVRHLTVPPLAIRQLLAGLPNHLAREARKSDTERDIWVVALEPRFVRDDGKLVDVEVCVEGKD